jgi:hypothetical protein
MLRNQAPVTGTTYSDYTGPGAGGTYYYYVTAISDDPNSTSPLCESAGSDTIVVSTVGLPEHRNPGPRVYPNPATGTIHIESDRKIISLQVLNYKGQTVTLRKEPDTNIINLDISGYPAGVYFFRVTDQDVTKTVKVIVSH